MSPREWASVGTVWIGMAVWAVCVALAIVTPDLLPAIRYLSAGLIASLSTLSLSQVIEPDPTNEEER